MKIVNHTEDVKRMGKKEHIAFLITQSPAFLDKVCTENAFKVCFNDITVIYTVLSRMSVLCGFIQFTEKYTSVVFLGLS